MAVTKPVTFRVRRSGGRGEGRAEESGPHTVGGAERLSEADLRDFEEARGSAPGPGISRLSAAILRINQSLDLPTVLQEAVDSACALTGANGGVITTIDERGAVQDFVTSAFSPEERRQMLEWPDGPRLFEHLSALPAPLRLADFPGYLESLGLSAYPWPVRTLQAAPMSHRGEQVGHFFLGDKEGGAPFTDEDEEILVLFASQAATAIANARTHRDVERARADLEALVETSPVGVVVFDGARGGVVFSNGEAGRMVEAIRTPGVSIEHLLETMTWRLADGREYSFRGSPVLRHMQAAMSIRGEKIELSVPDGRSVRALVNATPIRSDEGRVVSLVVTMQDLAPLEELERQRTEFLEMVSHELRAPLTSIKGSTATVLGASPAPPPAEVLQFLRIIDGQADHMRGLISNLLDAGSIEAGTLTVSPEPTNVAALVDRARTTFLTGGGHHPVVIDLPQGLPRVMADPERIVQVLGNLLSNAARHSPSSSSIRIEGASEGASVALSVSDEGRGIEPNRLPHLFTKHADVRTGTGLGLAISKGLVEAHGGRIRAESAGAGQGARFTFTLPAAGDALPAPARDGSARAPAARRDKTRVLVVDDDPETLRYVRDTLSDAGYDPLVMGEPARLSNVIRAERPALVLLDLMFPDTDGIELMKELPELSDVPVIFISGYRRDETVAKALESGAADYITKPFSPPELVARVGAALRGRSGPETFEVGELAIDYGRRSVAVSGRELTLTATEFDLLRVLSLSAGRVVTNETLLRQVWGLKRLDDTDRVRTAVKKLRAKLGDNATSPTYLFTQHGVGYRLQDPDEA